MKKNQYFIFLLILIVITAIYFPCINAYFVNDDYNWIKPVTFDDVLKTFWGSWGHGALYRPISRILFYLQYKCFGEFPFGYHAFSLFLFSTLSFLFYSLVLKISKNFYISCISLLICIFYVGNHEVVCWISSQTVLLGVTFVLSSTLFYLSFLENNDKKYLTFSLLLYVAALLSYESTIILPFFLVLIAIFKGYNLLNKKRITLLLIYLIITIIYLIARHFFLLGIPEANAFNLDVSIMISNFLKMIKFQIMTKPYFLIVLLFSLMSLIFSRKNLNLILFGLIWFIIAFIPYLFVDGFAGRFSFLSMFGVFIIIGTGFSYYWENSKKWKYASILILMYYFVYGGYLINKNAHYWYEAGEIARTIPIQLREISPTFSDNSTLIFYDIPLGYQQSGVFLTYFEEVVQRNYNEKLNIIHVSHPFNKDLDLSKYEKTPNTFKFKYYLEERSLKQLK